MMSSIEAWIRGRQRVPGLRLFCFPHAGAGASAYRLWPSSVDPDVEVCRIQYPGREDRLSEPLYTDLHPLVETLSGVIAGVDDAPFAFYGHSVGALIAFEVARSLRRAGRPGPVSLFVSGRQAPHLPQRPALSGLPEAEFVERVNQYGSLPDVLLRDPDLRALFIGILRADLRLLDTYRYTADEPLDCPLWAAGGSQDPTVSKVELDAWSQHTCRDFQISMFPGKHFFLHEQPHAFLQELNRALRSLLVQA